MKVLLSAYACEPSKGSEPAIGWNWARQAARFHEVWVLTRANNRDVIEAELARSPVSNMHFVYYDLPRWARFWKRAGRGVSLYYWLWQVTAIPVCRRLHREIGFDLAHHVTFVSFRFPSCLAWLSCPFVWGPVAGAESAPLAFYPSFGLRGMAQELLRDASNRITRLEPMLRYTMSRADMILAATEVTKESLPRWAQARTKVIPAIGIDERSAPRRSKPHGGRGLRVLYAGRLQHWKGLRLAFRAFAKFAAEYPDACLTVVGDGPDRGHLQTLARRLGIDSKVSFTGERPHDEMLEIYGSHDALLFPSFHDSGGLAVLEAMNSGLPVICLDLGGPAMAVRGGVGITIRPGSTKQVEHDLAEALARLAADAALRRRMGEAGRRIAATYGWDGKGDLLCKLYDEVRAGASESHRAMAITK